LPRAVEPILLILGIALNYVGAGAWIVCLLTAIRTRVASLIVATLVIAPCAALVVAVTPGSAGLKSAFGGLFAVAAELAVYRVMLRPALTWETVKYARESARQTTLHMVLMSLSLIFLIPFAWLVVTSLKEESEMSKFPPVWIPTQQVEVQLHGKPEKIAWAQFQGQRVKVAVLQEFDTGLRRVEVISPASLAGRGYECQKTDLTPIRHVAPVWKNYPDALKFLPPETHYGLVFLRNTLQITALSIVGTLLASSMVAYGFARLRWPGRDAVFVVLLSTMMLPAAVTMMPVFLIFRSLGWVDTLKPLWVPAFFGSAFNIFLLRQFFLSIPNELEEAARIDGCSHYTVFWRIMLPQIKPALAALTIMAFMGAWNDFRGPLIYISSPENEPLAYALQLFQSAHGSEPGMLMAASTLVMIPVLALFFFTQRYFIEGITLTGIKG
jgi:multiple sugar transport system permease protein